MFWYGNVGLETPFFPRVDWPGVLASGQRSRTLCPHLVVDREDRFSDHTCAGVPRVYAAVYPAGPFCRCASRPLEPPLGDGCLRRDYCATHSVVGLSILAQCGAGLAGVSDSVS